MTFKTKSELLECLLRAVPPDYPIYDIDIDSDPEAVAFTWRRNELRIGLQGLYSQTIEEVQTYATDAIILLQRCLELATSLSRERKASEERSIRKTVRTLGAAT